MSLIKRSGRTSLLKCRSWRMVMTQASTNAPSTTNRFNNTGLSITWAYTSEGVYTGTLSSAVTLANLDVLAHNGELAGKSFYFDRVNSSTTTLVFKCQDLATPSVVNLLGTAVIDIDMWD